MTLTGPYSRLTLRSNGSVMVWSPPSVITRGSVLPFLDGPGSFASVLGARERMELWPSSICLMAKALSYLGYFDQQVPWHTPETFPASLPSITGDMRAGPPENLRSNGYISAVENRGPRIERIRSQRNVVAAAESDPS
jgi:hypothetical protein